MDHCSLESEVIDALDFLSPPVLRNRNPDENWSLLNYFHDYSVTGDCQLLNGLGNKSQINSNIGKPIQHSSYGSSTSLFLKKTQEKEIVQQRTDSTVKYLQSHEKSVGQNRREKPTIKVTVISNPKQKAKNRKKRIPRKVESTVSNQENSIKANNVFLVVSGRKKEKVYQVKATGSDKFPETQKKDEIAREHLHDIRLLMNSLNMDKKKKKGKHKEMVIPPTMAVVNRVEVHPTNEDLANKKSRVRISGKIGKTSDDQYYLNCAATIDDQPISTRIGGFDTDAITFTNGNDTSLRRRELRDSNVQAQMSGFKTEVDLTLCKSSQYSATNMSPLCFSNIDTLKIFANKDQQIQCFCPQNIQNDEFDPPNSPTPLVVISVYPKQGPSENKNEPNQNFKGRRDNSPSKAATNERKAKSNKSDNKLPKTLAPVKTPAPSPMRSRSPTKSASPSNISKASKQKQNESKSPPQISNKDTVKSNKEQITNKKEQLKQKPNQNAQMKNVKSNQGVNKKVAKSMGPNIDYVNAKKAIVDTYTKELTEKMKKDTRKRGNDVLPKYAISNVKVNIESEHEQYDFLYRQGELTTDFRVRKTLKDQSSQKNYNVDDPSLSMENFLLAEDYQDMPSQRKRSFSQTYMYPSQPSPPSFDEVLQNSIPSISGLNVRDSIELSHRRDESRKNSHNILSSIPSMEQEPTKHFPGDNCSITDPLERDREIRTLLGVNIRPSRSRPAIQGLATTRDEISVQCFYDVDHRNYSVPMDHMRCPKELDISNKIQCLKQYNKLPTSKLHSPLINKGSILNSPPQEIKFNRNISVYMELQKARTIKPIILSRKQYIKVRRSIDHSCLKRPKICSVNKKESFLCNSKKKISDPMFRYNKSTQTERTEKAQFNITNVKTKEIDKRKTNASKHKDKAHIMFGKYNTGDFNFNTNLTPIPQKRFNILAKPLVRGGQKSEILPELLYSKDSKIRRQFDQANKAEEDSKNVDIRTNNTKNMAGEGLADLEANVDPGMQIIKKYNRHDNEVHKRDVNPRSNELGICNDRKFLIGGNQDQNSVRASGSKHVASSVEIRYTKYAYSMKQVTFSTDNVGDHKMPPALQNHRDISGRNSVIGKKPHRTESILTLFKGHKRAPTPNLGTSLYSLDSNYSDAIESPLEPRPRKPFLRRLMSCLVMRSRLSEIKLGKPIPLNGVNSSIDSYHISTSLAAIDISSSLYDTSASFYSNHTIMPVNSKTKRGFFNSVRGFLTNRKC